MKKRGTAALLALLLIGGLACTPALAEGPPGPSIDSNTAGQTQPADPASNPGPTPEPDPTQSPGPDSTPREDGPETDGPAQNPPPEQPPGAPPPEAAPPPVEDGGCATIEELAARIARDEGGTVTVTGDLTLAEGQNILR